MPLYINLVKTLALLVGGLYALRFLIGLFSRRQSTYTLDLHRQFSLLFWSVLCLLVVIPLLGTFFTASLLPIETVFILLAIAVLLSFSLPTFFLHVQYWRNGRHLLVEVDKRNESFKIYHLRHHYFYASEKIVRTVYTRCRSRQYFWSHYEYLTFEMTNGDQVTVTSLLLPLNLILKFLPAKTLQTRTKPICWL